MVVKLGFLKLLKYSENIIVKFHFLQIPNFQKLPIFQKILKRTFKKFELISYLSHYIRLKL